MKFNLRNISAAAFLVLGMGMLALPVSAQINAGVNDFGSQTALGSGGSGGLIGIISNIINIGLGFLGILTVLFMLYGGFLWMTSGGDVQKVDKAKRTLTQAVIGLVVILSSWAITVFVLGAIGGATGANVSGLGNTPNGPCTNCPFNGPGPNDFIVNGIAPVGNGQNRNVVVRVVLNKPVAPTIPQGSVQIAFAGTPVQGSVVASGSTIEFTPAATCPNPNQTLNCFDPDQDFSVTINQAMVTSANNDPLQCGGLYPPCNGTFHTGAIVDTTNPTGTLTGPIDGMNFNINDGFTFQSQVSDDVGISKVDYLAEGVLAISNAPGAPVTQWTNSRNWVPADATLGKIYHLTGKVFDTSTNSSNLSGAVAVVARAAHCFNGVKDQDETGLDCGGAGCGVCTGGACSTNTDCATGTCVGGVCVAQPVITGVALDNGAEGNYVTISGQNFGTNGTVSFMGDTTMNVDASLACSGAWTNTQIIVVVPAGAKTGPITVKTGIGLSDATNDTRGGQFTFTVNTTKRPGVCSLSPWFGKVGDAVSIHGTAFGTNVTLALGALTSDLPSIDDSTVNFNVPSLPDAMYDGSVKVGTETSNPFKFHVTTPAPIDPPVIASVTPASGPVGQYITLSGTNFGSSGTVRFIQPDLSFVVGDVTFPAACGTEYWRPTTVIVKVPAGATQSVNKLVVVRAGGNVATSTNSVDFTVTTGAPSPGVCRMDPTSGPANTPVKFYGDAFGTTVGTVAFNNATANNPVEWAMNQLLVSVPAAATTGQVRVVSSTSVQSNPTFFQVGSCQQNPSFCGAGQQCCDNGSCSSTCSVSLPQQTYAWRFSTGKIPQIPKLVTQCDTAGGSLVPSPAPLLGRSGGNQVCTNAKISAIFDHTLDPTTVSGSAVQVWECADATCAQVGAAPISGMVQLSGTDGFTMTPSSAWTPTKTYLVEVKTTLKSETTALVIGGNAVADPACNRGAVTNTAYCWKFTAGATQCVVQSVAVNPHNATANEPYDANRSDETSLAYTAETGGDDRLCLLVVPPAGTVYTWDTSNASLADILNYTAAQARVKPLKETGASPVKVNAHVKPPGSPMVDGSADLNILFARPRVVSYEPNCNDACANSELRATFNTGMDVNSIAMQLMLCSDDKCLPETRVGNIVTGLTVTASDADKTFSISPSGLQKSSYYRVLIPAEYGANCEACSKAGISLNDVGSSIGEGWNYQIGTKKYFSWIFRVRNDSTMCSISKVDVEPVSATVTQGSAMVVKYSAIPRSNPDVCSPSGQALNPWGMSWAWAIVDSGKAGTFVNAAGDGDTSVVKSGTRDAQGFVSGIAKGYTSACVKRGADAVFGVSAKCGNGTWERLLGEACDDGNVLDGDGCSKKCLIEPFTNQNTWTRGGITGQCGDGGAGRVAQRNATTGVGEECDDGAAGSAQCTTQCMATGVSIGICGNSSLDAGEGCDDGNTDSGDGCSATCIAEGSVSSIVICGDGNVDAIEDCDNVSPAEWAMCNHSTCLWAGTSTSCGNGVKGAGEQCDDSNTVSDDGCSNKCLLEGSNQNYANPSFCGDGTQGLGEAQGSDANISRTLTDPVQYVRSVATPASPYTTEVTATAMSVKGTANFNIDVSGLGGQVCVVNGITPACGMSGGDAACAAVGGVCQTTVSGSECVILNAPSCSQCAAAGGTCTTVAPAMLLQCGSNAQPASIPSPAPIVVSDNTATTLQTDVCTNAIVSGYFNVAMNPTSLTNNLVVLDCGTGAVDATCASGTAIPNLATKISVTSGDKAFHVDGPWVADHTYLVAIKAAATSAAGVPTDPNGFVVGTCDGVTGNVHACWRFKVANAECAPSSIAVNLAPNPATTLGEQVTADTSVLTDRCLEIDGSGFTYTWNSQTPAVADFTTAAPTTPSTTLVANNNGTSMITAGITQAPLVTGNQTLTVGVAAETCPPGQGKGTDNNCYDRPQVSSTIPANSTLGAARNSIVKIVFDRAMDAATLTPPGAVKLEFEGACAAGSPGSGASDPTTIGTWCATAIAGTWTVDDGVDGRPIGMTFVANAFLPSLHWVRIVVSKAVKSTDGVTLGDVGDNDFKSYFKTSDKIAPLVAVQVNDTETDRPGFFTDPAKPNRMFSADAMGQTSVTGALFPIFPVANQYSWTWGTGQVANEATGWGPTKVPVNAEAAANVAAIATQKSDKAVSPSMAEVRAVTPTEYNDTSIIAATATIDKQAVPANEYFAIPGRALDPGATKTGTLPITVFPCKHPWPTSLSSFPWADEAGNRPLNFSMFYCRDTATNVLLPDLREQLVPNAPSGALKEYLFINSKTTAEAAPTGNNAPHLATLAAVGDPPNLMYVWPNQAAPGDWIYLYGTTDDTNIDAELVGPSTYQLNQTYEYTYSYSGTTYYYAYYQLPTNIALGDYTAKWITQTGVRSNTISGSLHVSALPIITGFDKTSVVPGDIITVQGTGFVPGQYIYVYFYGDGYVWGGWDYGTYVDATQIRVTVPSSIGSGNYFVYVYDDGLWAGPSSSQFTVMGLPPTVTQTGPGSGAAGTQISISGTNFDVSGNIVKFSDGTNASNVQTLSANTLIATVPSGMVEGTYTYNVTNASGTSPDTATATFQVTNIAASVPTISSISPAFGPGETEIVVNGTNFAAGQTTVFLSGPVATQIDSTQMTQEPSPRPRVIRDSSTKLRVIITMLPKGAYKFRISDANGVSALSASSFQITDPQIPQAPGQVEAPTGDVIGVRVMPNPLHLDALSWYRAQQYTGSPTVSEIDGYDAVIDGRTMYIAAANAVPSADPSTAGTKVYTNIYIISYNTGARADLVNIFNQLKKSLRFNSNLRRSADNINLCLTSQNTDAPLLLDQGQIIPCVSDDLCLSKATTDFPNPVCASKKAKLVRDVNRVADFRNLDAALANAYQETHQFPTLSSGSFLRAFSTSVWPSWTAVLSQALASPLPLDPLNKLATCTRTCSNDATKACKEDAECTAPGTCAAPEQATCWNEVNQSFMCPEGSKIYSYRTVGTDKAQLAMRFEGTQFEANIGPIGVCETASPRAGDPCDLDPAAPKICGQTFNCVNILNPAGSVSAPIIFATANMCNGEVLGAVSQCGDGIVGGGEICEIGQVSVGASCTASGGRPGVTSQSCASDCSGFVASGSCVANSCGDGIVSTIKYCSQNPQNIPCTTDANCGAGNTCSVSKIETCDDGSNNGKYGYCNATCSGRGALCGDLVVQPGEECDCGTNANGLYGQSCLPLAPNGCSASCTLSAPRCGDSVKQVGIEDCEVGEKKTDNTACNTFTPPNGTPGFTQDGRKLIGKATCRDTSAGANACKWPSSGGDVTVGGISYACVAQGSCGDGTKDAGEMCDDGNTSDTDSCTNTCVLNTCGDGKLNTGVEECDDGDRNGYTCNAPYGGICNFCSSQCKLRTVSGGVCGNSKQESGEQCDGSDYGGKICIGGDTPNAACGKDTDCGTGKCTALFCLNGLHCKAYGNLTSADTPYTGPLLRDWFAPQINFANDQGWRYCSNDAMRRCNGNNDCPSGGTCQEITTNTLGSWPPASQNNFSVRCEGYVTPKYSETYTFRMANDDNARLFLNNTKLIDAWVAQDASGFSSGSVALTGGKRYPVVLEHVEWSGGELLRLTWQSQSQVHEVIPAAAFSYAPDANLSCAIGTAATGGVTSDASVSKAKGICLGSTTKFCSNDATRTCTDATVVANCGAGNNCVNSDGTVCAKNADCGTNGICSFVPGTCFDPTTRVQGVACRSLSDCPSGEVCGAGICNGGRNNGNICSDRSQCADSAPCVFSKCNLTCSAFCPTEFQPITLSFKTINQSSKCVSGHRNNVGGLCGQDSDCNKASCSPFGPDCVGGTTCQAGKCQFPANYPISSCTGGYLTPDGTCAMCAPASASSQTASLGSYSVDNATTKCAQRCVNGSTFGVACTVNSCSKRCTNGSQFTDACASDADCTASGFTCSAATTCVNGPRDALTCTNNADCSCPSNWSCESPAKNRCLGGPLDGLACQNEGQCRVLPDRAWLTLPQCRAISNMTADIDVPASDQNTQDVYVVFITDMSASMVPPSGACNPDSFGEGFPYVPIDCDGDGNLNTIESANSCTPTDPDDTRLLCATNNLFGESLNPNNIHDRTQLASGALDHLFEIDPQKIRVALMDFSGSAVTYRQNSGSGAFDSNLSNWVTYSQLAKAKQDVSSRYDTTSHPNVGDTNLAFDLAKNMLTAPGINGKKVVIVLTDATDGDSGRASILAAGQNLKKVASADMYAISYARNDPPHDQRWQLKILSSDCPYSAKLPIMLDFSSSSTEDYIAAKNSLDPAKTNCLSSGFFTDALTSGSLSRVYDRIFGDLRATIKLGASGAGDGVAPTISTTGFERQLNTTFLKCDPLAAQNIPFYLNYAPPPGNESRRASVTNVKAQYCPTL